MPRRSSTKQKKNSVNCFEDSGLTDADRRKIRSKQRSLQKELLNDEQALELQDARDRNNDIFEQGVRFTREAVLDGDNVLLIAQKAAKAVDRMVQVPRYDADRLVSKLVDKCKTDNGSFDWSALGMEAGVCFNAIPAAVSFLNGPMMDGEENPMQVRQRATRAPRETEEEPKEEERPETIDGHTTRNADQLSAIEKSMKVLTKTLKKNVANHHKRMKDVMKSEEDDLSEPVRKKLKKRGPEICAIQYLFNPESFTQTVENIFHFSFLIKKGTAGITFRGDDLSHAISGENENTEVTDLMAGPKVRYWNKAEGVTLPRQAVVSFTMKDWRRLKAAYDVEKGDLPHRTGSLIQKANRRRTPLQERSVKGEEN